MRIVFMGTPDIAVPSLRAIAAEHEVAAVFCQPDKPIGRKREVLPPPVKAAAAALQIPVLQPLRLRGEETPEALRRIAPDLIAVMAYGKLLPKQILDLPRYGCVNAHASLLPKYRGAAPIQHALLHGERRTGVTFMRMDEGLDTGGMLLAKELLIEEEDDAASLFQKIGTLAAAAFPEVIGGIQGGRLPAVAQDGKRATYAPPIEKPMGRFTFFDGAGEIVNKVRAFAVWPGAWFLRGERTVRVLSAVRRAGDGRPGEVLSVNPLTVAAKGGAVELREVMPSGGRRMPGAAFAAGLRLKKQDDLLG